MGPYYHDAIRNLLAAATEDDMDECTALIPETLALLARMESLVSAELHMLASNLAMLAQCAEDRAARVGFERHDHGVA